MDWSPVPTAPPRAVPLVNISFGEGRITFSKLIRDRVVTRGWLFVTLVRSEGRLGFLFSYEAPNQEEARPLKIREYEARVIVKAWSKEIKDSFETVAVGPSTSFVGEWEPISGSVDAVFVLTDPR